ncbi:hypothetical protein B296_00032175 [Ensete ventricosum]|uniref:Uncharacterized protein n=1 Tax=Ensete ventricosum TaxID=4639 RepID=A0A426YLJ0_ENSVE|nr:hypothetical protein B296_00032175 [Ensete ventricosum]
MPIRVGNSLGVCRELAEDIGSLLGWRKGVRRKKTMIRWKIIGVAERLTRSWEGLEVDVYWAKVLDDAVKARRAFARTSSKVSGRSLETSREIARGR